VVEDATVEAQARQDELDEQPQGDRQGFRLFKNFLPELEANNGFRDHDDEEHPALSSHTFAASIRHVRVVLPHGGRQDQADDDEAPQVEIVIGRHFEDVLEEERV